MKIYGEWRYNSIILDLGTIFICVVNYTTRPLHPLYPLDRRLGRPRAGLDVVEERKKNLNLLEVTVRELRKGL
jgi:hypothetical protein